ncbi:centromere protein cenp-h [Lasius niger]|uniref:Centromere protein cenp-h n=1 Tax=Lasius niger TaxID=67767 RepID=A0A0J7JVM4_LASNI|nr:centromere protein cenp-h [Lasius niger]
MVDSSRDGIMMDGYDDGSESRLPLSPDEQRVLDLYDTLQQLQLEIAIINALASQQSGTLPDDAQKPGHARQASGANTATHRRVNAGCRGSLGRVPRGSSRREGKTHLPLSGTPATHPFRPSSNALANERHCSDLLSYVERRDEVAISVAKQVADMGTLRSDSTKVQVETAIVNRHNAELTAVLCHLAERLKQKQVGSLDSPGTRSEMALLEDQVKSSRQRWRVMKGVAGGMISGSGIDWARDDELRDAVLDPENEV